MTTTENPFAAELCKTAKALVSQGKGILAADESSGTIAKRFAAANISCTEENRKKYRQLLFTTEGIEKCISGVILFEETFYQTSHPGHAFSGPHRLIEVLQEKGILVGIKVDKGLRPLSGGHEDETFTDGINDLRARIAEFRSRGAKFAKWRAAFHIRDINGQTPTQTAIECNANLLAGYATICQENGIVPIIEPEVLMEGNFGIEVAARATERVLTSVYNALLQQNVLLEGTILKPNMVRSGNEAPIQASTDEIAYATIDVLARCVPANVPGICFLSGGMSEEQATAALNRINVLAGMEADTGNALPWKLSFSYGRALQNTCLHVWAGKDENEVSAQALFQLRAHCNSLATLGLYRPSEERITEAQEGREQEKGEYQRSGSGKPSTEGDSGVVGMVCGDAAAPTGARGQTSRVPMEEDLLGLKEEEDEREECKDLLEKVPEYHQQKKDEAITARAVAEDNKQRGKIEMSNDKQRKAQETDHQHHLRL